MEADVVEVVMSCMHGTGEGGDAAVAQKADDEEEIEKMAAELEKLSCDF